MVIVFTCSHVFSITQHLARSLSTLRRSAHFIAQSLAFALCTLRLRSATMRNNKKPMSIPSKTRKGQKTHEHSSKCEQGVQKHQKNHEHTIKDKKRSKNQ